MATYTTLRIGSTGDEVKKLQTSLGFTGKDVDGIYGNKTAAAVRDYQSANGLSVDGIAGNQTLGSLYGGSTPVATTAPSAPAVSAPKVDASAVTNNKKLEDYGSFDYADYVESDAVTQWKDKLDSLQKPDDYKSNYGDMIAQLADRILNREKFTYDVNGDALYQQYKDQYITQGKLAMQDTIGQAAAMTGGFGNSYAENAGQQAYHGYLQQLNDRVPELYQLALDQYNREGEDMYNQYGLLADREATEYGRHRDTVSDYQADRGFLADQYNAERSFDYSKYSDDRNFDYSKFADDRNLNYQLDRDAVADSQWRAGFDEQVRQFEQDYKLKVEQIEEDKRHNLITEDQAQQQINLAREEFEQSKREAAANLTAKYVTAGYKQDANGNWYKPEVEEPEGDSKGWFDYSDTEHQNQVKENGGSYYQSTLTDLKDMKEAGKSNADANAYLLDLVGNSVISRSEYMTLYNKYRDDRL